MRCHPFVSIVVPAHNSELFVAETLRSIQRQTFEEWECVVVDDGSTDGTVEAVAAAIHGDFRFRLIRQGCRGVSIARNQGFHEGSRNARFVSFMDSDDCWEPNALERLVEGANRSGSLIGAHGLGEFIGPDGLVMADGDFVAFGRRRLGYQAGEIREWPLDKATCFASLCWTGPLYPPGLLLVRRKIYEMAGLFDQSMRLCEDWDMAIRLSRYGDIGFINQVILKYRRHSGNASLDQAGNRSAVRRLHHKTFFSEENRLDHKELLREGWLAWQRFKIKEKWNEAWSGLCRGTLGNVVDALVGTPVYLLRYARGFPGEGLV